MISDYCFSLKILWHSIGPLVAAAQLINPKDIIIILNFGFFAPDEARKHKPRVSGLIPIETLCLLEGVTTHPSDFSICTAHTFVSGIFATGSRAAFVRTFVGVSAK